MNGNEKHLAELKQQGQQLTGQPPKNLYSNKPLEEGELSDEELEEVAGGEWNLYGPDDPLHPNQPHKDIPPNTF